MNGGSGKEREERAVDALLISGLRPTGNNGTEVAAKDLPVLSEEERGAMNALGGNFIQKLLAGEYPIGLTPEEPDEECPEGYSDECDELALAGNGADCILNRAEEVDDETAKELAEREREILERKAREQKDRSDDDTH